MVRETCWTLIRAAAAGGEAACTEFADSYERVLRTYFQGRWRGHAQRNNVDDAIQEVFLVCFREGGVLNKAEQGKGSGFRGYLHGVARNVALHFERGHRRDHQNRAGSSLNLEHLPAEEPDLATLFDRAYARTLLRAAAAVMGDKAKGRGPQYRQRVELLKLRFMDGLAIKDIASKWQVESKWLHHQYEQAQKEFRACFREVVGESERLEADALDRECESLLAVLR